MTLFGWSVAEQLCPSEGGRGKGGTSLRLLPSRNRDIQGVGRNGLVVLRANQCKYSFDQDRAL